MRGVLLLVFVAMGWLSFSQSQTTISERFGDVPLSRALPQLSKDYGLEIFYLPEWLEGIVIDAEIDQKPPAEALNILLRETTISVEQLSPSVFILFAEDRLVDRNYSVALKGQVLDGKTGEAIANALVGIKELAVGSPTDAAGNYTLDVPANTYIVSVSGLNWGSTEQVVELYDDKRLDFELFAETVQLEDVIISAEASEENLTSTNTGRVTLQLESIRKLPALMGEVDISRIVQSLPGVQSVGEGSSGFNVRGGSIDQNLVLMDGIPILNSSHLLGLFSVFNPDLIDNFTVLKGSIPAHYGGRASSVIAVDLQEPDTEKFSLSGGVGPVSNKLSMNVPVNEDFALLLGGRYSNPSWILGLVQDPDIQETAASFADANVKARYQLNPNNVLGISGYWSEDFYDIGQDSIFRYSTVALSGEWIQNISDHWFTSIESYWTQYRASLTDEDERQGFDYENGTTSTGLKIKANYVPNEDLTSNAGVDLKFSQYLLGEVQPEGASSIGSNDFGEEFSTEMAIFGEISYKLTDRMTATGGLRYSSFFRRDVTNQLVFDSEGPKSPFTVVDTLSYNGSRNLYNFWEPRVAFSYRLDQQSSVKGSLTRSVQYEHLFSNSTASLPTDLWRPSSENIVPQVSDQVSLGYFRNLSNNKLEASVEVYYKRLPQLNVMRTGANVMQNETLDADILEGEGRSYGVEIFLKKPVGRMTGWVSYTLSRTENRVANRFREDQINDGDFFLADFDRPHNLNISGSLKLGRLWTMSGNFVYFTGRPVTVPVSSYTLNGLRILTINERNNIRTPDTHRLDLSWTLEGSNKKNARWKNSFTFSLYNVYARANPFSVFVTAVDNVSPQAFKLTVLGNVIPSFTYNFKF
ncbi:MAG: carboxypeptidase-like regulatory domain-containing protein [Bacteroidota bacterium]